MGKINIMNRSNIEKCFDSIRWQADDTGYLRALEFKDFEEWRMKITTNPKTGDPSDWDSLNNVPIHEISVVDHRDNNSHAITDIGHEDSDSNHSPKSSPQWTHFLALPIPMEANVTKSYEQFLDILKLISPKS